MSNCALHIQQKTRRVFDGRNRVIPDGTLAVCSDTGEFRIGNGRDKWRELVSFTPEVEGDRSDEDLEGYTGPLHVVYVEDENVDDEATIEYVPEANELVVLGTGTFAIGNGVENVGGLPKFVTTD